MTFIGNSILMTLIRGAHSLALWYTSFHHLGFWSSPQSWEEWRWGSCPPKMENRRQEEVPCHAILFPAFAQAGLTPPPHPTREQGLMSLLVAQSQLPAHQAVEAGRSGYLWAVNEPRTGH